jgi:hypothetical protein
MRLCRGLRPWSASWRVKSCSRSPPRCGCWWPWSRWTDGKASILWPGSAESGLPQTPSRDAFLSSATEAGKVLEGAPAAPEEPREAEKEKKPPPPRARSERHRRLPLSDRAAEARRGATGQPGGLDALELPGPAQPTRLQLTDGWQRGGYTTPGVRSLARDPGPSQARCWPNWPGPEGGVTDRSQLGGSARGGKNEGRLTGAGLGHRRVQAGRLREGRSRGSGWWEAAGQAGLRASGDG